ncbi:MAG: hypothetical protein QXP61_04300 [Nitrososphaerales archaeon]
MGRFVVPRLAFYATFFTLLGFYLAMNANSLNMFASIICLLGTYVFWYEALRIWKTNPVTANADFSHMRNFIVERKIGMMPYVAPGIVIILTATIGFAMLSNLVKEYENTTGTYRENIGIGSINVAISKYPADKISESIMLSKQKMSYATQENAYDPGVPLLSENSSFVLALVLPLTRLATITSIVYVVTKIRYKERVPR